MLGLKGDGKFDTRSYYQAIRGTPNSLFPWKGVWKPKIPKRVAFFLWIVAHDRILTLDNLMHRGRPLAIGVVCVVVMESQWITFFFIVLLHIPYGLLCFKLLVFIGLCQDRWRDCYLVGISGLGSIIRTFGI